MKGIGVIGLGIMGGAMARHLAQAGREVVGFDIATDARKRVESAGGRTVDSAAELASRCRVIITSLPAVAALETIADQLAGGMTPEHVLIEASTMPLSVKHACRQKLEACGAIVLDCPVSGTGAQAAVKDLVVYASGDAAAFERVRPVLADFSRRQVHLGRFGNGSVMKFIANLLVNIHNVAAAEALVLARLAGMDLRTVYETIQDGAGGSRMFQLRGPLMVEGKYDEPTARIDMYMKDLDIITAFAAELRSPTPLFSAATQLYYAAERCGLGKLDTAAVSIVLEELAGLRSGAQT